MTDLANQRRMAAEVLDIGVNRVWFDPEASKDISAALTREDIRKLVGEKKIAARAIQGVSRGRARKVDEARKYGHRKGHGSRSGAKGARMPRKEQWVKKIRALRKRLNELKESKAIDVSTYRKLYNKAKGGEFRSRSHLNAQVELLKTKEA